MTDDADARLADVAREVARVLEREWSCGGSDFSVRADVLIRLIGEDRMRTAHGQLSNHTANSVDKPGELG